MPNNPTIKLDPREADIIEASFKCPFVVVVLPLPAAAASTAVVVLPKLRKPALAAPTATRKARKRKAQSNELLWLADYSA